jgi:NADH-quinone oxidoreductase subunit L
MVVSSAVVFLGLGIGWWLYGRKTMEKCEEPDPLQRFQADIFTLLRRKYFVDEIYEGSVIAFNAWWSQFCDALDFFLWNGLVHAVSYVVVAFSWVSKACDDYVVNLGFDGGCEGLRLGGKELSHLQNGKVQNYLRAIGVALAVLALLLIWGCRPS